MTESVTAKKRRPAWLVVLRAAGAIAALGCLILLAGMLGQSTGIVSLGTNVLLLGAATAAASGVTYVATR